MKNARALVALALISVFLAGLAHANTSGVNPNVPAQNSPLSSSVFRGQFAATASDINTIYGILTLSSNQILGTVNAGNAGPLNLPTCSTGALSWTPGSGFGCNSITGLTSPVTQSLVFTGAHAINLNSSSLPTKQVGTVIQIGNADTIPSRIENDAFAASAYFSGVRLDGTNAAPTTLQNLDEMSGINAWGYNGSSIVGPRASVREYASQNWTGSAQGTRIDIATTLNNTTTMLPVCGFENDGGVTCPPTVTGGDQGAGKINAAGLFVNGVAVSVGTNAFSSLTAATTTNSIENGANAQTWNWDTATTQNALTLSSTGNTTGQLFTSSIANAASTGYAGYFSNTGTAIAYAIYGVESGAANTGYAGYFSNTATATGYALYANGTAKIAGNLTVTGTCTGCGGGGGSGTVNSGTTPDLAFYATSTSALSDATGLQYSATTKGLNLNGVNAHSLPDNGLDTTGVAIGASALLLQTSTGANNTAAGASSLAALTTGINNTSVGFQAATSLTIGGSNTVVGRKAATGLTTGSRNTVLGDTTTFVDGSTTDNVVIGQNIGMWGAQDVLIGAGGSFCCAGSTTSVVIGYNASSTQGNTVSLGAQSSAQGGNAIAIGAQSAANGGNEVVIGGGASRSANTGANSVLIGFQVAHTVLSTGVSDILIGGNGGIDTALGTTSTAISIGGHAGSFDTGVGFGSLGAVTTNALNSAAFGYQALGSDTSGANNTAVGYQAGQAGIAITTGTQDTFVGYQAQANSATAINRTAIGYQAISTADNDVVLGNSSVATIHAQVTSITGISDRRLKNEIKPSDLGLDFVMKLRPVTYRLKASDGVKHLGFIAQDTEAALPDDYQDLIEQRDPDHKLALVEIEDDRMGTYNMNYGELTASMVKAIQDQQAEIEALKKQIAGLSRWKK